MHIKLALPLAAQLSLHFCWKFENQLCCTSTRDLFKDATLIVRDRKEKRKEEKRRKKPCFQWELNSGPVGPLSDVLPLELSPQPLKKEQ